MSLCNKSVLITGATGGIGKVICEEFLRNGIKNLAALDLNPTEPNFVEEWRKKFPEATIKYFRVDVSLHEELEKCYADFTEEIPSLDIVVNCAGFLDERIYRRMVEVNLCGVIGSTLTAMRYMRKDKGKGRGGIILTIASATGLIPLSLIPTYSATKHGVIAFMRGLAHDRDYMGIKFLTLCPGGTQSQMYNRAFQSEFLFETTKAKQEALREGNPAQSPELVAEVAVKLMEEAQSGSVWLIQDSKLTEQKLPEIEF